jgi:hypothetical protein
MPKTDAARPTNKVEAMSLLRLAFWLALIVLLLPTDAQQQARLSNSATTAMERVTTFCDRNSRTCSVGGELWATFLKKAEFGLRLVGDLLGAGGRQVPEPRRPLPPRERRSGKGEPRGTLPPPDLYHPPAPYYPSDLYQPPWRGPPRYGGG